MPPQNDAQKQYLLKSLQQSNLSDGQRQYMWDTFTKSSNQDDFVKRINAIPGGMADSAKQSLYDLRYNPSKYMDAQGNPIQPGQQKPSTATPASQPGQSPDPSLMGGFNAAEKFNQAPPQMGPSGSSVPIKLLTGIGESTGIPVNTTFSGIGQGLKDLVTHPIDSAEMLYKATNDQQQQLINEAYIHQHSPGLANKARGFVEGMESAIPMVGPAIANAGNLLAQKKYAEGIGATLGLVGPMLIPHPEAPELAPGVSPTADFHPAVIPKTTTPTTSPTVPTQEVPVEVAPHPEAQPLAKSAEIPVSAENPVPESLAATDKQQASYLNEPGISPEKIQAAIAPISDKAKLEGLAADTKVLESRLKSGQGTVAEQAQVATRIDENNQLAEEITAKKNGPIGQPTTPTPEELRQTIAPEPLQLNKEQFEPVIKQVHEMAKTIAGAQPKEDVKAAVTVSKDAVSQLIDSTPLNKLGDLHDAFLDRAQTKLSKATAIRNLVDLSMRNEANAKFAVELRSTGGPVRSVRLEDGTVGVMKPEAEISVYGRSVFDRANDRVPRFDPYGPQANDMIHPRWDTIPPEVRGPLLEKQIAVYQNMDNEALRTIQIAQETHQPLEDTDIVQQLRDLTKQGQLIWKIPDAGPTPGRRPNLPPPIDANGNITNPGSLWTMDTKTSKLLMDSKANERASYEDLLNKATEHENTAKMLTDAAHQVTSKMNGQRGAIGEQRFVSSLDKELPDSEFNGPALVRRAKAAGLDVIDTSKDDKPISQMWYSADGKIGIPVYTTHPETIQALYPEFQSSKTAAMRVAFDRGMIRKGQYNNFEMARWTDAHENTITNDMFKTGIYGRKTFIDIGNPYADEPKLNIELAAGWDKLHNSLNEAVAQAVKDARRFQGGQRGALSRSAVTHLASANIGAGVGGVIGIHIAGPAGGIAGAIGGWGLGFLTPDLLRTPVMFDALSNMKPLLDKIGVTTHDWLLGKPQPEPIVPEMRDIIKQQHDDIQGSHLGIMQRMASMPNDFRRAFVDRLVLLDDQHSALGNFFHRIDPNARIINPNGRLSLDDSPYVTLYNAATDIRGEQAFNHIQYSKILRAAQKAGLATHLDEYLNLKVYKRTFNTLVEHAQNFGSQISADTDALKDPNLSISDRVHIEDRIANTRTLLKDALNTIQSRKAVPGNYTIDGVSKSMKLLQDTLGPEKVQQLEALSSKVYDRNRAALDLAHDQGVVSDANYNLFISRGNDYIPMSRIMNDLATDTNRWSGNASPAYLRKQNIIHAIEGSERVNRSPIVASESWNNEVISEALRNRTVGDYVKMAEDNPDYFNGMFNEVDANYKAKAGEMLVGHYENGQPHTYAVPKLLGETLQNTTPVIQDVIGGAMGRFIQNSFKMGATTLNLGFSAMRPLTDLSRLAVLSEGGVRISSFPKDLMNISKLWAENLKHTITRDPTWEEAIRQGYPFSTAQRNITPEAFLPAQKLGWKARLNVPVRMIHGVADFNALIEDSIKMTAFRRLKEQGWSDKAAEYETKRYGGAPDYARKGSLSQTANLITMFFNADIQHITQAYARLSENPKRLVPILGSVTAATMMLAQHNWAQKDENGQPLMRRIPYQIRDRDWVYLTGQTIQTATGATVPVYYRQRKPDWVVLFMNPVENTLNKVAGREERTGTQLALDAIQHSTPFTGALIQPTPTPLSGRQLVDNTSKAVVASLSPLARVPIEEMLNERMYSNSPIVTNSNIDAKYQFDPSTSTLAKDIGAGIHFAPQRVEHIAQGFTGGASRLVTSALEPLLRQGGAPPNIAGTPEGREQIPVIGPMLGRFTETATNQAEVNLSSDFYGRVKAATRHYQTFLSLAKSHPNQAEAYAQSHREALWQGRLASEMTKKLSIIDQAQRELENNTSINPVDRRNTLKNIYEAKMRIMQAFDGLLKNVPAQGLDTSSHR